MSRLRFSKLSGAGNDFLIFDARTASLPPIVDLARGLCPRRRIGADGVIVLTQAHADRIRVGFANADGSAAEFCGNGARCVARYAVEADLVTNPIWLEFPGQTVRATVRPDQVEIQLELAPEPPEPITLTDASGAPLEGWLVDGGAPHAIFIEGTQALDLEQIARRYPELYQRANLTALAERESAAVSVRTYERGAGYTAACGSAAIAAGALLAARGRTELRVCVIPPSRIALQVEIDRERRQALLSGDALWLYDGLVADELLAKLG